MKTYKPRDTFPESTAEILLLEIFCEKDLINVGYTSTGTNCQNLFQSAVEPVSKLFETHGIKPIFQALWPNRIPDYFRVLFDVVNRKKNGKWSDGTTEARKKLKKLEEEREKLRVEWPDVPSRQQMKDEPGYRSRILSELLSNKKARHSAASTPGAVDDDVLETPPATDANHLSDAFHSNGSDNSLASPIVPPQAPYVPSPYPDSSDILGGISGPSSTMIERSPQPQTDPSLPAGDSFLGECFWPSDVRQPSRFDEGTNYDFNALSAAFQFDPDPQGLSQTSWDKDSICSGNGGLPEHFISIPQDPLTPSSSTSHVELNSVPIRQPIPIRKRKLDDLTSRPSTPGSSNVQSPHEPPRKKRKPYETEALQALSQDGFVPVQSQVDYHATPNPWLLQPTPTRSSTGPTPRAPSHQTLNPPFDHQLSSSHPQSQDGFSNGYQDPSNVLNSFPSFPPAGEGSFFSESQTYQLPLNVARPSSRHPGTAGPSSQVVSSRPPSHSGPEADPARNRFINLAMRTAMEIFQHPWCRTNPPWNKLQQMARSEATWNAWTRILPPEHTYPGPPMSSQAF